MARSRAALDGRDYVIPDDVRRVSAPALRHRVGFHYRRALEGVLPDEIVSAVVAAVPVP
jgi:MoxR-like ATPase